MTMSVVEARLLLIFRWRNVNNDGNHYRYAWHKW